MFRFQVPLIGIIRVTKNDVNFDGIAPRAIDLQLAARSSTRSFEADRATRRISSTHLPLQLPRTIAPRHIKELRVRAIETMMAGTFMLDANKPKQFYDMAIVPSQLKLSGAEVKVVQG
jgi:hypothetical protein